MANLNQKIHVAHLGGYTFTGDHKGVEITIDGDWGYSFPLTSPPFVEFIASQDGSTAHLDNIIKYLALSSFRDVEHQGVVTH